MIYVDELRPTRKRVGPFPPGTGWCHLTTDGPIEELHEFAARIGMKREWFQNKPSCPHYDLEESRRDLALRNGAVFRSTREQLRMRRGSGTIGHDRQDYRARRPDPR